MNVIYSLIVHVGPARKEWKLNMKVKYTRRLGQVSIFCRLWSAFSEESLRPLPVCVCVCVCESGNA